MKLDTLTPVEAAVYGAAWFQFYHQGLTKQAPFASWPGDAAMRSYYERQMNAAHQYAAEAVEDFRRSTPS